MSDSLLNKGSAILNAIAITAAIAVISGQLPARSYAKLQPILPFNPLQNEMLPHP